MRFKINSKKLAKTLSFWAPDSGGYIHLESPGREGCLGSQITKGNQCLRAVTENDLAKTCRNWYRRNYYGEP